MLICVVLGFELSKVDAQSDDWTFAWDVLFVMLLSFQFSKFYGFLLLSH